jgi:antirestriction protein
MPRIYVACLASYNSGVLHGAWIDVTDVDQVKEEIQAMLAKSKHSPAEEYAIHDYEGFEGIKLGEYEDIARLVEIANAIDEHGEVFTVAYANFGDVEEAIEAATDHYAGTFRTLEDWAEQFLDDTGAFQDAPDVLKNYFDYEKYALDAELGGDVWTAEGGDGIHVFYNH